MHHIQVKQQLEAAQALVRSGAAPWAAVCVWGFADSPVSWVGMEHSTQHAMGLSCGCESHYAVVIMQGGDLLIVKALGGGEVAARQSGSSR